MHGVVCFIYFGSLAIMAAVKLNFNELLYEHSALEPTHLTQVRGRDPYMPCVCQPADEKAGGGGRNINTVLVGTDAGETVHIHSVGKAEFDLRLSFTL